MPLAPSSRAPTALRFRQTPSYNPPLLAGGRVAPTLIASSGVNYQTTTATKATASLSWVAGDFLIIIGGTEDQASVIGTPTTGGAGLAFTPGSPNTAANSCWANSWTGTATGAGSGTISATATGGNRWGITVWQFRGSDGQGTRLLPTPDTAATLSLSRSQANSFVCQGLFDWGAQDPTGHGWTPTGQTEREASFTNLHYTSYAAEWPDQGAAGTTSYGVTGITMGGATTKVAVEVLGTGAAGGSPFTGSAIVPARRVPVIPRRGGRVFAVVPAQTVDTPSASVPNLIQPARRRPGNLRRGVYLAAPQPTQVIVSTPPAPQLIRARRTYPSVGRRSRYLQVPQATPTVLPPITHRRAPTTPARRGEFWVVPPAQVVAGPGPLIASLVRAVPRRVPPIYRRGDVLQIPLVGAAPALAPPFPPPFIDQTHTRPAGVRRGRFLYVPPAVAPAVPTLILQLIEGRRPLQPQKRRGTFARVVAVVGAPPRPITSRRRPKQAQRRGTILPWWPQAVVTPAGPSTWVPNLVTRRRPLQQRRRPATIGLTPQHSCITARPSSGTTTRPNTGTTAYALATTARPNSGTTARPDTGTTDSPC